MKDKTPKIEPITITLDDLSSKCIRLVAEHLGQDPTMLTVSLVGIGLGAIFRRVNNVPLYEAIRSSVKQEAAKGTVSLDTYRNIISSFPDNNV